MISSKSSSVLSLLIIRSTYSSSKGVMGDTLAWCAIIAVERSSPLSPLRGCATGLKKLSFMPCSSIARTRPMLTVVRPTLVPTGINIILRDIVTPAFANALALLI